MKKLFFLFVASFALVCCSDDDSGLVSGDRPVSVVFDGQTRIFSYDSKGRLQTTSSGIGAITQFLYDSQNRVTSVSDGILSYGITYDANGHYASVQDQDGNIVPIEYLGNDEYAIDDVSLAFNANGDFKRCDNFLFAYNSDNGAFMNVNHFDVFAHSLADPDAIFYASKKRFATLTTYEVPTDYVVQQGQKGLPEAQSVGNHQMTYDYTE